MLHLLLLEEPELHFVHRLLVVFHLAEGFDEGGLGFGGGLAPVVAGLHVGPVHSQFGAVQGVFGQPAHDFLGGRGLAIGPKQGQGQLGLQAAGAAGPVAGRLPGVKHKRRRARRTRRQRPPEAAGVEGLDLQVAEVVVGELPGFLAAQGGQVGGQAGIEVAQGVGEDGAAFFVLAGIESAQLFELPETGHDELGEVAVSGHFFEPREGPAGLLHGLQLGQGAGGFGLQARRVEQGHEAGQALGFALGIAHPGRFLEQQAFEFLVLGQLAGQGVVLGGGAALGLALPLGQHGFEARVAAKDVRGQQVGVQAAKHLLRAFKRVFREVGQALHGVPSGVVGGFEGEGVVAAGGAAGAGQFF